MCLIKNSKSKWLTAKRDIKVYKLLTITIYGSLKSPFMDCAYNFGINKPSGYIQETQEKINGGCLHSYTSLKVAKDKFEGIAYSDVIMECVIPKGAKYLKGMGSECVSTALDVKSVIKYKLARSTWYIQTFERKYNIVWS